MRADGPRLPRSISALLVARLPLGACCVLLLWDCSQYDPVLDHWEELNKYEETDALPELLPSVITGWLLLHRCGLDYTERSVILAATQNNLEFEAIEQALTAQWTDDDLSQRDNKYKPKAAHVAFYGEDQATWEDLEEMCEDEDDEDETAHVGEACTDATKEELEEY